MAGGRAPLRASRESTPQGRPRRLGSTLVLRPDPEAWSIALDLVDGDPDRLVVNADGSVDVLNS